MVKKTHLLAALALLFLLGCPSPAQAQTQIIEYDVDNDFGETITFSAQVQSESPVQSAQVSLWKQGEPEPLVATAEVLPRGRIVYRYDVKTFTPGHFPPRAFSTIEYQFKVILENGENFSSEKNSFVYIDNRFTWKMVESGALRVHWYQGEDSFAQDILEAANAGLEKAGELLPLKSERAIDVYVYASAAEMQPALVSGQEWVAGQTSPDLGVAVVSLAPGHPETRLEARRQLPHELMHILLYQNLERGYANLPAWLNEGLASLAEATPNPDYLTHLEHAIRDDTLIPLASLCTAFPTDISGAILSYAQANSFTQYLYRQYGSTGLDRLVKGYADGLDCRRGIEVALGSSLDNLEERWLEDTFGVNALQKAFTALLPWLILFSIIIVVPVSLALGSAPGKNQIRQGGSRSSGQAPVHPAAK